jgi:hypothetical protein
MNFGLDELVPVACMQEPIANAILRTLAFHAAWNYAPTRLQLFQSLDVAGDDFGISDSKSYDLIAQSLDNLISQGVIVEDHHRLALAEFAGLIQSGKDNEIHFARKMRNAWRATRYLKLLPWVRSICLCNTTALGQARDQSDLDFFIICRAGTIWRTRFFATIPFKILNARPGERQIDPVCLSFFITDQALNLQPLVLDEDDPYFRHWFLSLMPLTDDGVLADLWEQNRELRRRHPFAKRWIALKQSPLPGAVSSSKPGISPSLLERWLRQLQTVRFPKEITQIANQDSRVIINDNVLKFHVTDNRKLFRDKYYKICHAHNIQP